MCIRDSVCTANKLPADMMFVHGAWAEELLVPVGGSYENRGMRNDQHDAVSAMLKIPIARQPGGASQPAGSADAPTQAPSPRALAAASTPAATHTEASQPGAAQSPAEDDEEPENWQPSPITSDDETASCLHQEIIENEKEENIPDDLRQQLGHILFMKKTVTTHGITRKYVARSTESRACIKHLLRRRNAFMEARSLGSPQERNGGAPQPAAVSASLPRPYVFTVTDRQALMQEWQDEYHGTDDQIQLQKQDSWKPLKGKTKGQATSESVSYTHLTLPTNREV